MLPAIRAEFYKLIHSKKLLITSAIIIILLGGISYLDGYINGGGRILGIRLIENLLAINSIFYYFSLVIVVVFVCYEYRFQTIKNYIISGQSRYKFIINKLLFLGIITFSYLFLAHLISGLMIFIGMIMSNTPIILENFDVFLLRFLISIIIAFQFIIFFTSIQVIFKSSGMTIGFAIGFPILFALIIQIIAIIYRKNNDVLTFLNFFKDTDISAISSLLATENTIDILKPLAWSLVLFTALPLTIAFIKVKKSEL